MTKLWKQAQRSDAEANVAPEWMYLFDDWTGTVPSLPPATLPRSLGQASKQVYRNMWQAFGRYCTQHGLTLDTLAETDLEQYLRTRASQAKRPASAPLSARYAWRMLHLVDRLLRHDAKRRGTPVSLVATAILRTPAYRRANCIENDKMPACLSEDEEHALVAYLSADDDMQAGGRKAWRRAREHAAVAVMLGAGLTPAEMRRLTLADIGLDGGSPACLHLSAGTASTRTVPLAKWAAAVLCRWLHARVSLAIAGQLVFPATLNGKPWSHTGSQEACRQTLARAGLPSSGGGLFRLRHSFALHHLKRGVDERMVSNWLGHRDPGSMAQYRELLAVSPCHARAGEQL